LIGEEVEKQGRTLSQITKELADIICKRAELGKNYGVILVPEGLIEFIPEVKKLISEINEILSKPFTKDIRDHVSHHLSYESRALFTFLPKAISDQLLLDRDPHGNVQVSKIDTERLLILLLRDELETRTSDGLYKGEFYPQAHFFGYEGRCAIPSNFDSQYCYSLGLNAAILIREGASGYMSCVKNLKENDPTKWIAAGCPLPTMMHLERRKGKDVPVIKKALVDLEGQMFQSYVAVREKWAYLDCFRSPGPIQFHGPSSDLGNFLVSPPVIADILKETEEHEKFENSRTQASLFHRHETNLSALAAARIQDVAEIPETLEANTFALVGVKKYKPYSQLVKAKISEQYPILKDEKYASYFVEVQDKLMLVNDHLTFDDPAL
jgi:pyrophosphate--fructose-6-phosphate 1-phosphotransferase